MAEAIILPVTNLVLRTIALFTSDNLLMQKDVEQNKALESVNEDLLAIADDLRSITIAVLEDAAMKVWLTELKNVVYDVDDLLDEVATDALHRAPKLRYYLSLKHFVSRFDLTRKIKLLRLELDRIVAEINKLGLTDRPVEPPSKEVKVFDRNGVDIVGRDKAKNDIISIVSSLGDEAGLSVLPVLGMGGIGKTSLAKLVYNDIDGFDIKLWVCVSDKFDLQRIVEDILNGVNSVTHERTKNYSLDDMVETVQRELNGRKFFLVLDDLWEDDITLLTRLKDVVDVGEKGSVVLITTRLEKVALITKTVEEIHHLDRLSDSDCWPMFASLAFADAEEQERWPRLCEIGKWIVEKCLGIPLVVQCMGSMLRGERDEAEWVRILSMDSFNVLQGRYNAVKQLLKLSYDKLPSHLKPCFAHLALFAKDVTYIPDSNIYYWRALGLLQELDDGCYSEQNIVYDELLSRSMIQDEEWNFNYKICTFKVHDLLHDLAGDVLGEELAVVAPDNLSVSDSSRYVSWGFSSMSDTDFPEETKARKARAFIFRYEMKCVSRSFLKGIISGMPYLRILALGSGQFEELPISIGDLKHLRVLNLSNNQLIKSLPETVCELLNLECLFLDRCPQLQGLPAEIYKLVNLRFLTLTSSQKSFVGTNFSRLPSLQSLCIMSCPELESLWEDDIVGYFGLTSLCDLRISDCPKLRTLPNSLKLSVGLKDLRVVNCEEMDLERESGDALSGLLSVETVAICGVPRLSRLPDGMQSMISSLKYMWVQDCEGLVEAALWLQLCPALKGLRWVNCPGIGR